MISNSPIQDQAQMKIMCHKKDLDRRKCGLQMLITFKLHNLSVHTNPVQIRISHSNSNDYVAI